MYFAYEWAYQYKFWQPIFFAILQRSPHFPDILTQVLLMEQAKNKPNAYGIRTLNIKP
jgi:hypothetical protein